MAQKKQEIVVKYVEVIPFHQGPNFTSMFFKSLKYWMRDITSHSPYDQVHIYQVESNQKIKYLSVFKETIVQYLITLTHHKFLISPLYLPTFKHKRTLYICHKLKNIKFIITIFIPFGFCFIVKYLLKHKIL